LTVEGKEKPMRGRPQRDQRSLIRLMDPVIREIHAINAEAKACRDPYLREQLYLEKTKLQSHLLREWGEHIEVLKDPEYPGMVSLTRRSDGRDACHARWVDLDPDVRAELRR
jgi:hypothetical protein